jgi:ABC-type Fe3+-siderophore transport system permease subunit
MTNPSTPTSSETPSLTRHEFVIQASMGAILGIVTTIIAPILIAMTGLSLRPMLAFIGALTVGLCVFAWRLRRHPRKRGWSAGILLSAALGGLLSGTCFSYLAYLEDAMRS